MLRVDYHGHSCVQLTSGDHSIIIDAFLTGNPLAKTTPDKIHVQYVLLTHAHSDHIQDAAVIAKQSGATIIAIHELATFLGWQGVQTSGMNIGGKIPLGFAEVQMVPAFHSSGIILSEQKTIVYAGMPAGLIIRWDGFTVLHAGDTSLYSDMKMIGERNAIDLAFLPIGDWYTMGPEDAATAAEWLRTKLVVPVHYNTFSAIKQDGAAFVELLARRGIKGLAMQPGQSFELVSRK